MRKLRVTIFDDDPTNLKLFAAIMSARDYEVQAYDRAVLCPVYAAEVEACTLRKPCADIVITDNQMPRMTGIEMLLLRVQRGCKIDVRNEAVASADLDTRQRKIIEKLGCAFFSKPFRLSDMLNWLDACEKRVDLSQPLGIVRQGDRYPANITLAFATQTDEKSYQGTALNFSANGFCLETEIQLGEEESIVIKSDLPNGCRNASVRWVNKSGDCYLAGFSCSL